MEVIVFMGALLFWAFYALAVAVFILDLLPGVKNWLLARFSFLVADAPGGVPRRMPPAAPTGGLTAIQLSPALERHSAVVSSAPPVQPDVPFSERRYRLYDGGMVPREEMTFWEMGCALETLQRGQGAPSGARGSDLLEGLRDGALLVPGLPGGLPRVVTRCDAAGMPPAASPGGVPRRTPPAASPNKKKSVLEFGHPDFWKEFF